MERLKGRSAVAGDASGTALVTEEPLSLWGGLNPETGEIIDRRHPLSGEIVTGRVLVLPYSRGSSTTSTVLLESIRAKTAPAAIISSSPDSMLALGSIVGAELYQRSVPVIFVEAVDFRRLRTGDRVTIRSDGTVEWE